MDYDTKMFYLASVTYIAITGAALNDLVHKHTTDETGSIADSRARRGTRTVEEVAAAYKQLYVCAMFNPAVYWFAGHNKIH